MTHQMESCQLFGKEVWMWSPADEPVSDVIIVLEGASFLESLLAVEARLGADASVALVGFGPLDWDRDLTPWLAPGLRKGEVFGGHGRGTLDWMLGNLLPWIRERFGSVALSVVGYSLGGLMALWCCYESDVFSGCASCSGSLWYDGWVDYQAAHRLPRPLSVYLSLGDAEEKTKNLRLARVGDVTRRAAELIQADSNALRTTLVWNPGGHFNDPAGRMADALVWLLK